MSAALGWRGHAVAALLLTAGAINLLPGILLLDPARAVELYGVAIEGPVWGVLMRHRAVLLAMIGVLLVVAAFRPSWRPPALALAFASKLAFLALMALEAPPDGPLDRIAAFDIGALVLLAAALALAAWRPRS